MKPNKMTNILKIFLCLSFLLCCAGCSGELRKKFVRQKKEKKETPVIQPQTYESEFTKWQRYINHFTFWKNAEHELIALVDTEDRNEKKLRTYAEYSLKEIKELYNLLPQEKAQELNPFILELIDLVGKIKAPAYVSSHRNTLTRQLIHHYKEVHRRFSYNKMKKFLED